MPKRVEVNVCNKWCITEYICWMIVSPVCVSELKYHELHEMFQHNRVRISITGRAASSCQFVTTCFQLKVSLACVVFFH
jgi:hypothetical protein